MSDKLPLPMDMLSSLTSWGARSIHTGTTSTGYALINAARMVAERNGIQTTTLSAADLNIKQIAAAWDSRVRGVRLSGDWWLSDNGPLLAFDQSDTPYALLPASNGEYTAISGIDGTRQTLTKNLAITFSHHAYLFYPCFAEQGLRLRDVLIRAFRLMKNQSRQMIGLQAMLGALSLLIPIAMGRLFNEVIPSAEYFLLSQWSLILIAAVVLTGLLAYQQVLLMIRWRFKLSLLMQASLWDKILRLPVSFTHQFEVGDLTARSLAFNQIQQLLSTAAMQGLLGIVFSVFPLILMFFYSWQLSLMILGFTVITFLFYYGVMMALMHYQTLLLEQRARASSFIVQLLQNISRIRTQGAETRCYHVWLKKFTLGLQSFYAMNVWSVYLSTWNSVFTVGISLVMFGVAAKLTPSLSLGDFIAFFSAYGLFSGAVVALSQLLLTLAPIAPWMQRIQPLLAASREKSNTGSGIVLQGGIRLENVSFAYENQGLILNNISLTVAPGECVGIIGASGSGKSSLIRLLLGFLQPTQGRIFYDELELSELNLSEFRHQLGVVLQQDTLLTGTIYDNLCEGDHVEEAHVLSVLAVVDLQTLVERLPMGLHTPLLDGGFSLSAGERQRLLMARALMTNPRILLLDEASSALDNITQAKIHAHLMQGSQTKIIIAQRRSTLVGVDRLYKLEAGTLVPAELV